MAKRKIKKCLIPWIIYLLVFLAGFAAGCFLMFLKTGQSILGEKTSIAANTSFDEFGYNYQARIFVGPADGVDRKLDGKVWGDPNYAKDHLVMKWSKAWDDARFHNGDWTLAAWENNEWNGKVPGGSGEVWHYKIKRVASPCGSDGTQLGDGGYCIWGQFEVIFSQGTVANEHFWEAHANPAGYMSNPK